ncbi:MAG: DUF1616 domain-containing protein [Methanobacterium sp.]|jgi:uncharacterized membrane protein|nr:MAG: DUF1616 domain-containing protein [Methanobacterium sp.]
MQLTLRRSSEGMINMQKPTYRDLTILIILSISSLAFLVVPALDQFPVNLIPQLLIHLFLPGYALMSVIDPIFNSRSKVRRVVWSFVLSLILTLVSVYIPISSYLILVFLTVILAVLAFFRKGVSPEKLQSLRKEFENNLESFKENKEEFKEKRIEKTKKKKITGQEENKPVKTERKLKTSPQRKNFLDIILVVILTLLCALFVLEPTLNKTVVRTVLGLLLVLFFPGYALIASLFPKKDDLDSIERITLSFGLSIAITPLLGLVLNYTPWGIRLDQILISLTGITLLLCAVAIIRRRRIPEENLFLVDFEGFFRRFDTDFKDQSKTNKILSTVLILSIIFAIITTAYIIVTPKEGESFTEFYILGPGGKASDYPTNLTSGQEGNVIIGIDNHENKNTTYHLIVTSNNTVQLDQMLTLQNGEKMEIPFNFTAGEPGEKKMEFKLFKLPDNNNIYRSLHLWINVTG